jgi:predicted DsbA family dithiol-disulfide isomerase
LERAAWLERRYGARVDWYPFDLHPEYPAEGVPRTRHSERTRQMIEEAGFEYAPPLDRISNSRGALQMAEFARETGHHDEAHRALFQAYWSQGLDIGDLDVLSEIAVGVGLDAEAALDAVRGERFLDRILGSTGVGVQSGVDGVPAWVIDGRVLVPGAQPHEVFDSVLSQLGHRPLQPDA